MHIATSLSCLHIIDRGCINGDLATFGVTDSDWTLLRQATPWTADKRSTVERIFHALVFGAMDAQGIARVNPPAEYIAAVLSTFVNGANLITACRWVETFTPAEDIANGAPYEPATPDQLFSMCCMLEHQTGDIASRFEKKMGLAQAKAAKA